ncbi:MAG: hypothetical protein ACR2MB_16050 [Acidimicrobiales bacterium]
MDADRRRSDARAKRWVLFAFLVVALIPIAGAAVRMGHAGWVPEGDDAMIARRTMSVFSTEPPLTGQPSTAGNLFTAGAGSSATKPAAQIDASHPGPLEYYLLALPYRLGGWSPAAMLAAVALVNGASVVVAVVFAWRRLGVAGAISATVAVLVVAERLGTWNLARPLNASIAVMALLAGLVATWAALDGDRWAAVAAVPCLSLVIQAHLGAAPLAAVILLVALLVPSLLRRGSARSGARAGANSVEGSQGDATTDRPGRWPLVATALVLAVAWAAVALDQLTAQRGNVGRLVEVTRLDVVRAGYRFGFSAVFDRVVEPVWPGVAPLTRVAILGPVSAGPALVKGAMLVGVLALVGWWARRTGRRWLVRMVAVAALALVVPAAAFSRGPDEVRLGPSYQLTSLVAVSAFVAFVLAAAGVSAVTDRVGTARPKGGTLARDRRPQVLGVVLSVLAIGALASAVWGGPTYAADNHRNARLAAAIRVKLPPGTYRLAASGTLAYLSTLDAVSVDLLQHGYDIRVVRLGAIPKEPQRRATDIDAPTIVVDSSGALPPGARPIARLPRTADDLSWAGELDAAVRDPAVHLRVDGLAKGATAPPCFTPIRRAVAAPGRAAQRVRVARAVLDCPQDARRQAMDHLHFVGLDPFWTDLLGSAMVAPYPRAPLSAYLLPAPGPGQAPS